MTSMLEGKIHVRSRKVETKDGLKRIFYVDKREVVSYIIKNKKEIEIYSPFIKSEPPHTVMHLYLKVDEVKKYGRAPIVAFMAK